MANKKNLANGKLALPVSASDTIFALESEQTDYMPDVPFAATVGPAGELSTAANSEIVLVTEINGDTITVERAQRGTSAKPFEAGDIIGNGIYVEDLEEKVDKVDGMGLSEENFTSDDRDKLDGIEDGADKTSPTSVQESLPTGTNGQVLKHNGTTWAAGTDNNTTYAEIPEAEITAGTATTARAISGRRAQAIVDKARTGVVKSTTTDRITVSDTEPTSPAVGDLWVQPEGKIPLSSVYGGSTPGPLTTDESGVVQKRNEYWVQTRISDASNGVSSTQVVMNLFPAATHSIEFDMVEGATYEVSFHIGQMGGTGATGRASFPFFAQPTPAFNSSGVNRVGVIATTVAPAGTGIDGAIIFTATASGKRYLHPGFNTQDLTGTLSFNASATNPAYFSIKRIYPNA